MTNYAETYLQYLEKLVGRREDHIKPIESTRPGLPIVYVLFFHDWPCKNVLTSFTLGIAMGKHIEEVGGHIECVVSLDTNDFSWGLAVAFLAEQARDQALLSYGSTLNMGEQISRESQMSAFILSAPHQWSGTTHFHHGRRVVTLLEAHPIYASELEYAAQICRHEIAQKVQGACYDVHRQSFV